MAGERQPADAGRRRERNLETSVRCGKKRALNDYSRRCIVPPRDGPRERKNGKGNPRWESSKQASKQQRRDGQKRDGRNPLPDEEPASCMMHLSLSGMRFLIWQRGKSSVSEGGCPGRSTIMRLLQPISPANTRAFMHKKYFERPRRHWTDIQEQV